MAVRKVVTRSGGHSRGLMPSIKNPIAAAWESNNELQCYRLLELSPLVLSYEVQPSREEIIVDGSPAVYIPDVRAVFVNGMVAFFEVKPETKCLTLKVKKRLAAIRQKFLETDRRFQLLKDTWLLAEPRVSNLARLMYHRRPNLLCSEDRVHAAKVLATSRPATVTQLVGLLGTDLSWLLLGCGVVGLDLEKPLTAASPIFLEGGHRHANFFH